ncbi:MAG: hypothetical protein CMC08_06840 [Flavobacteriaceae bacterium]|nr:hypothetical protein [Flavobacteriaceae bacterium]
MAGHNKREAASDWFSLGHESFSGWSGHSLPSGISAKWAQSRLAALRNTNLDLARDYATDQMAAHSPFKTFEPGAAGTLPQRQKISQDFPEADIPKSQNLRAWRRSHAAKAMERTDLRRSCSGRPP